MFDTLVKLHTVKKQAKDLEYAQREKETKKEESKRVAAQIKRDEKEASTLMLYPPYLRDTSLRAQVVKALEDELLLKKRHHKFGNATISFGYYVKDSCGSVFRPNMSFPGWPREWPANMSKGAIRAYSNRCMMQVAGAFIEAHPDWTLINRGDAEVYPSVAVRSSSFTNELTFFWAEEE